MTVLIDADWTLKMMIGCQLFTNRTSYLGRSSLPLSLKCLYRLSCKYTDPNEWPAWRNFDHFLACAMGSVDLDQTPTAWCAVKNKAQKGQLKTLNELFDDEIFALWRMEMKRVEPSVLALLRLQGDYDVRQGRLRQVDWLCTGTAATQ